MPRPDSTQVRSALQGCYEQWRALTAAEGDAIREGHWPEVERIQAGKRRLQESIVAAARELSPEERDRIHAEFRSLIQQLICLEERNNEQLAGQRHQLEARRQRLEVVSLNLRQLREAYVPPPLPVWHSYS